MEILKYVLEGGWLEAPWIALCLSRLAAATALEPGKSQGKSYD